MNTLVKYFPVSETKVYAIFKTFGGLYEVAFSEKSKKGDEEVVTKINSSSSFGKLHLYNTVTLAETAIKREILPLYEKKD